VSASRGRRRRARTAAAAKARRQRTIAIGGAILFAVVLVIQVPRILKQVGGNSGTTSAAPEVTSPPPTTVTTAGRAKKPGRIYRSLIAGSPSDPFASRDIRDAEPPPGLVAEGRDPFVGPQAATTAPSSPLPSRIEIGTPRAGRAATTGYIVVLASVPTREGRNAAAQIAARARSRGVDGVSLIPSSSRKTLRAGYWVVYVGTYKSQGAAISAAVRLHPRGYSDAYIRELVRY
jgi:hypothetical protein